jgi:hypothetical protein
LIVALAGLAAALQSAPPSLPAYDHLPRKEMRAVIEACGFTQVWVGRDKAKREIVKVSDKTGTDDQLTCAATALDTTFYGYEFSPELAQRFAPIKAVVARPRLLAQAQARFAKEPERGPVPERLAGESSLAAAKRIEAFCGPVAEGAFVEDAGRIMISGNWMAERSATPDAMVAMADAMGCIMQASIIADIDIGGPAAG